MKPGGHTEGMGHGGGENSPRADIKTSREEGRTARGQLENNVGRRDKSARGHRKLNGGEREGTSTARGQEGEQRRDRGRKREGTLAEKKPWDGTGRGSYEHVRSIHSVRMSDHGAQREQPEGTFKNNNMPERETEQHPAWQLKHQRGE
ncbi:unnamed protein product [Calypogeia fissa]